MASAHVASLLDLALQGGPQSSARPPFGRLIGVSLALHCGVLLTFQALHLLSSAERPLVAQEVTLVSLPAPNSAKITPSKARQPQPAARRPPNAVPPPSEPKPVPKAEVPQPPQDLKARSEAMLEDALSKITLPPEPPPAPAPRDLAQRPDAPSLEDQQARAAEAARLEAEARAEARMEEALRKIELPPESPKFRDMASAPSLTPTPTVPPTAPTSRAEPPKPEPAASSKAPDRELKQDVQSLVNKLKVPEAPRHEPVVQPPKPKAAPKQEARSSLSDDIRRKLDKMERLEVSKARPAPMPDRRPDDRSARLSPPSATPTNQSSSASKPATLIQAGEGASGSSEYLARVQQQISKHWVAPPVDVSEETLVVVIKFRLHRSGAVTDVRVEESSGNDYYDLAAKRAVLGANPLPSFPKNDRRAFLDTHFTFMVGEQVS